MTTTTKAVRSTKATKATKAVAPSMFHFDTIENGKLLHIELPVKPITNEMLSNLVKADSELDDAIIGALFTGQPIPYKNGAEFVKAINESRAKGAKAVTKLDVKSAYDKLQAYARIIEIDSQPLQAKWDSFIAEKIAERETVKKENAELEAKGEKGKALPRITRPTVNGILSMLKPKNDVDHLEAALKSLKTAYNHFLELKGKKAQLDAEKLESIIVANGGSI